MSIAIQAVVLAAGKSSRFCTDRTKLSYLLCGKEMIRYSIDLLEDLSIETTVVVGYQKEVVKEILATSSATFVEQIEQRGTGHALLCTQNSWTADHILVLNGDAPLLTREQVKNLIQRHTTVQAAISFITSHNADPSIKGYGRVIDDGTTLSIVEQRDFTGDPEKECTLNGGIYLLEKAFLEKTLPTLRTHSSGELFITDLVKAASQQGKTVETVDVPFDQVRGINTLKELWVAERLIRSQLIDYWMAKGVRFSAPESVIIDINVTLAPDVVIGYGVHLLNKTSVSRGSVIDSFSILNNATVEEHVLVKSHTLISDSHIQNGSQVGPFANIHRHSTCKEKSVVGNFVEVSKSSLGSESKAKHLAYLGQAQIGRKVTIGAGSITCNYDGKNKHATIIKDEAFIGSNTALLAPVTIGKKAIIAAGSTITDDVPDQALAIARQRQTIKENYSLQPVACADKEESITP